MICQGSKIKPLKFKSFKYRRSFLEINKIGVKFISSKLILVCCNKEDLSWEDQNSSYLIIKASKRLGNAVVRNKIKRRIRSIFANINCEHYNVFLVIPKKKHVSYKCLYENIVNLLYKKTI